MCIRYVYVHICVCILSLHLFKTNCIPYALFITLLLSCNITFCIFYFFCDLPCMTDSEFYKTNFYFSNSGLQLRRILF